jgi:hypothetical protein
VAEEDHPVIIRVMKMATFHLRQPIINNIINSNNIQTVGIINRCTVC